ncbi:MAG: HD-GYP domain-containing protein [Nitrospirae bacterium]|nr:MAG: HD-GYP domain-containing protein [Nitrospirota bacterium]
MAFVPLNLKDLRLGLYIKLECSWWKHPFATNKFKVTSRRDLEIIKAIPKLKLYYDPELSDPLEETAVVDKPSSGVTKKGSEPYAPVDEDPASFGQDDAEEPPDDSPLQAESFREARVEAFRQRQEHLKRTERAYRESAKQTKAALRNLVSGDIAGLRMAEQMLTTLSQAISKDRTVMALVELINSADPDDPLVFHALNVCVLSLLVGKELELSEQELQYLGIGALSHDVGFLKLPRQLRLTTAGFAHAGADVTLHIEQGIKSAEQIPGFPEAARDIIAQHHERLNGKGYPFGLTAQRISQLAKIVMVVDEYDDLCNNPERQDNRTPYEALSYLYQQETVKRRGELPQDILVALIRTLGVYPPGTLVELTDQSIGMVISINPQVRTKPQVLLYVPNLSCEEMVIVDLQQEPDLGIQKSLRPNEVSREIRQYLKPQRMTGYFPSAFPDQPLARSHTRRL